MGSNFLSDGKLNIGISIHIVLKNNAFSVIALQISQYIT